NYWVGGILGKEFASAGYAVAYFSVRGTGDSGGCFGLKSKAEQRDLPVIIEWLADRPWSNGRVAMQGLSYPGTTPVMAAIQNPPALKTIVIAGTILDEYGFLYSPQGAAYIPAAMIAFGPAPSITSEYSLIPGSEHSIGTSPQRLCEEVVAANTVVPRGELTGDRNAEFWTERRFIDGVPGITAATFVVHGFQDRYGSGHAFQDDWAWQSLVSAPKRMLIGQWWHEWPNYNSIYPAYELKDWEDRLFGWFDYWLKGLGDQPPGLGEVEFQDSAGAWRQTDAWPPPLGGQGSNPSDNRALATDPVRRHDEVLYLREFEIRPRPGKEEASFMSVVPPWTGGTDPDLTGIGGPAGNGWRWTAPCPDPSRLVYMSDPVKKGTVLAGNPIAWLNVKSSAPGGVFELQLYDVGPGFRCDPTQTGSDIRPLTEGSADFRYHESEDYQAHPYSPLTRVQMRVDLANLSEVLEPGHRLAVVISHGFWRGTTPELSPLITLHGDGTCESSHLVVPVISGGFGGKAPTLNYPPRPFLPARARDADASRSGTCSPVPKKNAPAGSTADEEEEQAGDSSRQRQRPTEAGGTQAGEGSIVQGSALAFTGASVLLVVVAAMILILLGVALIRCSRSIRYE
ncbi:MAG: CocE/NonD family hydrolase, partial [Actinobacteria bacterium]|nr:CocE/NonD family hydrolase [Actinomycetota bacterium]